MKLCINSKAKRNRTLLYSVTLILLIFLACRSDRSLTQERAEKIAGIFCLPKYLPNNIAKTPELFEVGEPEIPDTAVLYKYTDTSERAFVIIMNDVSETSPVKVYREYDAYNPIEFCDDVMMLSNGLQACNSFNRLVDPERYGEKVLNGPPFKSYINWQIRQDNKITIYSILSSLSLEETKDIASSICVG